MQVTLVLPVHETDLHTETYRLTRDWHVGEYPPVGAEVRLTHSPRPTHTHDVEDICTVVRHIWDVDGWLEIHLEPILLPCFDEDGIVRVISALTQAGFSRADR